MSHQAGFILPAVLIFLMAITLLGMNALTLAQLESHMALNFADVAKRRETAETGLRYGEKLLHQSLHGVGHEQPAPLKPCFIAPTAEPWRVAGCAYQADGITGFYAIEQISHNSNNCLVLRDPASQQVHKYHANYYRITSWVSANDAFSTILQSTSVAAGAPLQGECHSIEPGRMSWREVEY